MAAEPSDMQQFIRTHTMVSHAVLVPEVKLYLATELSPLWNATAELLERYDVPPPYWAFPWVGGQAVARYVLDHPELVAGKRVLDFAAGSGIVAIAAMRAGAAHVRASEIDPHACEAMRLNAALNDVQLEITSDDLLERPLADLDVVLAGDIFYEKPLAERGLRWMQALTRRGVPCLCGDPGRIYSPKEGRERLASYRVATNPEIEEGREREAVVYRVTA